MRAIFLITVALVVSSCRVEVEADPDQAARVRDNVRGAAETAGRRIEEAARDAGTATAQATTTGKVKSALGMAAELDATKIDVDTVGKTVYLRGSVPSDREKDKAERITRDMVGEEFTVVSELTVGRAP